MGCFILGRLLSKIPPYVAWDFRIEFLYSLTSIQRFAVSAVPS